MDGSSKGRGRPHLPKSGGLVPNVAYPVGIQSNRHATDSSNRRATDSRAYPASGADTLRDSISTNVNPIVSPLSRDTSTIVPVDNVDDR
jgi:hypothetical protein